MGQKNAKKCQKMPKNAKKSQNMFFLRSTVRKLLSEVIKKCYYKYFSQIVQG